MRRQARAFFLVVVSIHVELLELVGDVVHLTGALGKRLGDSLGPGELIKLLLLGLGTVEVHGASIIVLVGVAPAAGHRW